MGDAGIKYASDERVELNEIQGYWTYLKSIDWTDPWLIILMLAHLSITAITLKTKDCTNFQIFLFSVLLTIAYFSENINEYAAVNWKFFSKQQYFDSNGLFISTIFSIPILLNCMLLIGAWLYNSAQMISQLKTAQLRKKVRHNTNKKSN